MGNQMLVNRRSRKEWYRGCGPCVDYVDAREAVGCGPALVVLELLVVAHKVDLHGPSHAAPHAHPHNDIHH